MKTFQQFLTEALNQDSNSYDSVLKAILPKTIGMRGYDTKVLYKELKKHFPKERFFFAANGADGDDYGYNFICVTQDADSDVEDVTDYEILYSILDVANIYDPQSFFDINKGKSDIHGDITDGNFEFFEENFLDDVDSYELQEPSIYNWLDSLYDENDPIKLPKLWVQKLIKTKYLTKDDIKKYNIKLVDKI